MMASSYSVSQSSSEAGFTLLSTRCTASSPRTSQPASISISTSGLRLPPAPARSTKKGPAGPVAAHLAAGVDQHFDQRLEARCCTRAIDQQGLGGAADAGTAHLRIEHDRL